MIERFKKYSLITSSITLLYILSAFIQGCEQDFVSPEITVRFPHEVEAQLNELGCNAFSCHNTEDRAGGLDLENWENAMGGTAKSGAVFIPYNGYWSHFIAIINGDPNFGPVKIFGNVPLDIMHKKQEVYVQFFKDWIDQGAQSENGDVAFTNVSKKLFIANQRSDMFAVVDAERSLVTRLVSVDEGFRSEAPYYFAANPEKSFLYLSLILAGKVLKINVNYPYNTVGSVEIGRNPAHIVISPDGNTGYVSNLDSSYVQRDIRRFDPNTMTPTGIITDERLTGSHGMEISPNGQYLFVASLIGEWLFKINTATFQIELAVPMSPEVPANGNGTGMIKPYDVKISPDGNYLFISCSGWIGSGANDFVKVFRTSDLEYVKDIEVGQNPLLMNITPNGQQLWVCNRNSYSISVIDVINRTNMLTIDSVGIQPHGVVFSSNGSRAFVSNESLTSSGGHHQQVGNIYIGVNTSINTSTYTLDPILIETASYPSGIILID